MVLEKVWIQISTILPILEYVIFSCTLWEAKIERFLISKLLDNTSISARIFTLCFGTLTRSTYPLTTQYYSYSISHQGPLGRVGSCVVFDIETSLRVACRSQVHTTCMGAPKTKNDRCCSAIGSLWSSGCAGKTTSWKRTALDCYRRSASSSIRCRVNRRWNRLIPRWPATRRIRSPSTSPRTSWPRVLTTSRINLCESNEEGFFFYLVRFFGQ